MQQRILDSIAQINIKLSSFLTPAEEQIIREYFGINEGPAILLPKYGPGDPFPGAVPMPNDLVAKIPKLKDYQLEKDPNGSILIVNNAGRVAAVIAPLNSLKDDGAVCRQ